MDIDLSIQRSGNQILLTLTHLTGLKWLDDAIRDAQLPIRHRAVKINSDRASKTTAIWTGSKRIVERKETGRGRSDVQIAVGTMPTGGKAMLFDRVERDDVQLPFSVFQGLLDGFHQTRVIGLVDRRAILDRENQPRKSLNLRLSVGTDRFLIEPDPQKALLIQESEKIAWLGAGGYRYAEGYKNSARLEILEQRGSNAGGSFGNDLPLAFRTESARHPWHQELQIIVDLSHRADGGPRGANPICLLDRNRRRNTENFVHQRFVHPLEKLASVRTEGFDVSALPFRVDGVKSQA